MAVYTQLANEAIAELLARDYALGPFSFALGIAEGVENSNYLVAVGTPGHEQKYVLTLYEKRVKREELPFFIALMRHLAEKGVACPQPIPRKDSALVGELNGRACALVSFLPGHSHTVLAEQDVASVGAALAQLHLAAADFSGRRDNALSLAGWQKLAAKLSDKLDTLGPGLTELVAEELEFLRSNWPKDLPKGTIHADLFPDNVFFIGNQVSGIIDFYFACTDFLAYDVAVTMNAWCFQDNEFNPAKAQALLGEYQKLRALIATEKAALSVLLRGAALRFLLTRAHDKIFHEAGALVVPHDPLEYVMKLKFHRGER